MRKAGQSSSKRAEIVSMRLELLPLDMNNLDLRFFGGRSKRAKAAKIMLINLTTSFHFDIFQKPWVGSMHTFNWWHFERLNFLISSSLNPETQ